MPHVFIGLFVLLAVTLACGPLSSLPGIGKVKPTPTLMTLPNGSSGGSGGGDAGSAGSEASLSFSDAEKAGLKNFRAKFTYSFSGKDESGSPVQGSFTMDQAHSADPAATYMKWAGEGTSTEGGTGNFELTQIGEVTYYVSEVDGAPKCLTMSSAGSTPASNPPTSPEQFMSGSDFSKARRILPDESVNGVLAQHYQFNNTEVSIASFSEWTNYTVNVWNAVDGKYTVKATFSGDGKDFSFKGGTGHVDWTYEVTDVNAAVNIQPPAGCEAPADADFPIMPDAAIRHPLVGRSPIRPPLPPPT